MTDTALRPAATQQRGFLATPADVERRLYQLSEELDQAVVQVREAETEYLATKTDFDLAFARAYMTVQGKTMKDREALALIACEDQRRDLVRAEALVRACKENAKRIYTHVDIARSVSVIVRAGIGAS